MGIWDTDQKKGGPNKKSSNSGDRHLPNPGLHSRSPSPGTTSKATIAKPRRRVLRVHGFVRRLYQFSSKTYVQKIGNINDRID
jgi:hypothetical protein